MLHTYELSEIITVTEERLLDEKLTAFFNAKRKYDSKRKIHFYGEFSKIPFKLGIKTIPVNGGIINYLIAIINPMKLMEKDYIHVASMDTALIAHDRIKEIFKKIGIADYFDFFNLRRIDYTFNIDLGIQEKVEIYIKLMKRGDIPKGFSLINWRDEISHRNVTYPDSIYMKNKEATVINFYNKYNQLLEKASSFIDCDEANGILRLEVQCKGRKIASLGKRYGINASIPQDYFDKEIAEDVVISKLLSITKHGDYYRLSEARNIIMASRFNDRQKAELIDFITEVNTVRSLNGVKESGEYPKHYFKKMLKRLGELNINPVTIPVNWNYDYLPNLLTYM